MLTDEELVGKLRNFDRRELPEWVPTGALAVLDRVCLVSGEQVVLKAHQQLVSLHLRDEMKYSWGKVKKLFPGDQQYGAAWFTAVLLRSLPSSWSGMPAAAGPAERYKNDAIGAAVKLEASIRSLPKNYSAWGERFNSDLAMAIATRSVDDIENVESEAARLSDSLPAFQDIVGLFREILTSVAYEQSFHTDRPGGATDNRNFFIKSLTAWFQAETSQPCRRIVADAAATAFECDIGEREVIRITKNLPMHGDVITAQLKALIQEALGRN